MARKQVRRIGSVKRTSRKAAPTGGRKVPRKNAAGGINKVRSKGYKMLSFLGDANAILSGDATKMVTRLARKEVGQKAQSGLGSVFNNFFGGRK